MSSKDNTYGKPILITLIGIVYLLLALALIAISAWGIATGFTVDDWNYSISIETTFYAMILVGLFYLVVAIGLLKGIWIFWYLGVIGFILGIVGSIWSFIDGRDPVTLAPIIVDLLLIYYMFTDKVKAHFDV